MLAALSTHLTEIVIGAGPGGGSTEHAVANDAVAVALLATPPTFTVQTSVEPVSAVVVTAENSDFRSWYGADAHKAVEQLIQISRDGADGRVIDAREWMPDDTFADGHHMYDFAAPTYTSRLTKELILPAIRDRSRK